MRLCSYMVTCPGDNPNLVVTVYILAAAAAATTQFEWQNAFEHYRKGFDGLEMQINDIGSLDGCGNLMVRF